MGCVKTIATLRTQTAIPPGSGSPLVFEPAADRSIGPSRVLKQDLQRTAGQPAAASSSPSTIAAMPSSAVSAPLAVAWVHLPDSRH
jgi:hypothetical protein